jgi:hypothetical protein
LTKIALLSCPHFGQYIACISATTLVSGMGRYTATHSCSHDPQRTVIGFFSSLIPDPPFMLMKFAQVRGLNIASQLMRVAMGLCCVVGGEGKKDDDIDFEK